MLVESCNKKISEVIWVKFIEFCHVVFDLSVHVSLRNVYL